MNQVIKIPHLEYTVYLKDVKQAKGQIAESLKLLQAGTTHESTKSSTIWIKLPITFMESPTLGHEIIHVLQNICRERNIDFILEEEHVAYLFHYIMNECLGYKYK